MKAFIHRHMNWLLYAKWEGGATLEIRGFEAWMMVAILFIVGLLLGSFL